MMKLKPKASLLSLEDQHALAAFFALHHGAIVTKGRLPGPRNIERIVAATFGLVAKDGPYRLTARGERAVALAKTEI